jgi:hypothetical protein
VFQLADDDELHDVIRIYRGCEWNRGRTLARLARPDLRGCTAMSTSEPSGNRTQLDAYLADLEQMWATFDQIYDSLTPAQWSKKYGKDWTYADQPYHLMYFDREIAAEPLEAGPDMPEEGRWKVLSARAIDGWNAKEFAKRPAGQTPQQSVEEWRRQRERVRTMLQKLTDADLGTYQVWGRLVGGMFTPLLFQVEGFRLHNWGELTELQWRLKRPSPEPPRAATQAAAGLYLGALTQFCRPEAATKPFTIGWEFTGPASSSWTMRVADGECQLVPGPAENPDLRLSMTPEMFSILFVRQAKNPMLAMLRGEMKVKGLSKMGMMKKLFVPDPDKEIRIPGMG